MTSLRHRFLFKVIHSLPHEGDYSMGEPFIHCRDRTKRSEAYGYQARIGKFHTGTNAKMTCSGAF